MNRATLKHLLSILHIYWFRAPAYLVIISTIGWIPSVSLAQQSVFENKSQRFAITPPAGWQKQESIQGGTYTIKFLSDHGSLTVAVKDVQPYHQTTIGLIKEHNYTKNQLADLAKMLYGKVPGIMNPSVFVTHLSSERALASSYVFQIKTLDMVGYIGGFKIETIHIDRYYKIEITGALAGSYQEAQQSFGLVKDSLLNHVKTFVFIPG